MTSDARTPHEYLARLPDDRRPIVEALRVQLLDNLPPGFAEQMQYGMLGYVVPHSLYPKGYHTNSSIPLPFINLASQKNYIALYHSGIYVDAQLKDWFVQAYAERVPHKLDMGKSCIRFKKMGEIPYALIGELATKMTPQEWIDLYEANRRK